jgi:ankyrin repeat protein
MGAIPSLRLILDSGGHEHVNHADVNKVTPLMRAATDIVAGGEMIKLLLERSAEIDAKDNDGKVAFPFIN